MLKKLTTAAVTGALLLPGGGVPGAVAAETHPQSDKDRYELATASSFPKSGPAAAQAVDNASERLARRYTSLDCRAFNNRGDGLLECIGSTRAKKALSRKMTRMIRGREIVRPSGADWIIGVWTPNSQRLVRIDRVWWDQLGTPI